MNNTFDKFNSRNVLTEKPYEKPLSVQTQNLYYQHCVNYIKGLKIVGKLILESQKTGFLDFFVSITSLLYDKTVLAQQDIKYMLTYKLSQETN
nr:unnamed protein product [Callosobruchus analis]